LNHGREHPFEAIETNKLFAFPKGKLDLKEE